MKTIIITLVVIIAIIVLLQSFTIMTTKKTEEQKYTIIHTYEDFEIRFYPATTIATIQSAAKSYKELSGPGFQQLAGYIFGGNEGQNKIAMTTPVHMDINDTLSTMSFVMPSVYNESNLPKPNNPNVRIQKTTAEYVAAIRFGGFASQKELKHYSEKLQQLLKEKGIGTLGHYRFLGYNPPFQVVDRRNEIIVAVEWKEQ
jgi:SOUL heme-binding protein